MSAPKFDNLEITTFPSGVCEIAFNRPKVLNAFSAELYKVSYCILCALKERSEIEGDLEHKVPFSHVTKKIKKVILFEIRIG